MMHIFGGACDSRAAAIVYRERERDGFKDVSLGHVSHYVRTKLLIHEKLNGKTAC